MFVHITPMHIPSKFHGKQAHGLKVMMKIHFRSEIAATGNFHSVPKFCEISVF
jgi:hypothetical protein